MWSVFYCTCNVYMFIRDGWYKWAKQRETQCPPIGRKTFLPLKVEVSFLASTSDYLLVINVLKSAFFWTLLETNTTVSPMVVRPKKKKKGGSRDVTEYEYIIQNKHNIFFLIHSLNGGYEAGGQGMPGLGKTSTTCSSPQKPHKKTRQKWLKNCNTGNTAHGTKPHSLT